jgi:predicted GH43/DUF377 family glycosyl hydrolase
MNDRMVQDRPIVAAGPLKVLPLLLEPDPSRTVLRPFDFAYPPAFATDHLSRPLIVAERVLGLEPDELAQTLDLLLEPMRLRHRNAEAVLLRRYAELGDEIHQLPANDAQKLLIGGYFSQEYAFESAALFNPSIVRIPRETGNGDTRFVLSLRGVGEGHISSVTFRTGTWAASGEVIVDRPSPYGVPPRIVHECGDTCAELLCEDSANISETVIFPILPTQSKGVEDLRLVQFTDEDGQQQIIGTYTAFNGQDVRQELLQGLDFRAFRMRALGGTMSRHKGMALFPRRLDGKYVMLGRQDNENIWLLESDDLCQWDHGKPIVRPKYFWEFVQLGNCGSPIEIDEGWLVFTHGVAMVRAYCIGACLLDKRDPSIVLARSVEPLLIPSSVEQRGGYVPNVVYSCGALVRDREVLLPFAIGDRCTAFATGTVDAILSTMA